MPQERRSCSFMAGARLRTHFASPSTRLLAPAGTLSHSTCAAMGSPTSPSDGTITKPRL